jgi:hypothetical protein
MAPRVDDMPKSIAEGLAEGVTVSSGLTVTVMVLVAVPPYVSVTSTQYVVVKVGETVVDVVELPQVDTYQV